MAVSSTFAKRASRRIQVGFADQSVLRQDRIQKQPAGFGLTLRPIQIGFAEQAGPAKKLSELRVAFRRRDSQYLAFAQRDTAAADLDVAAGFAMREAQQKFGDSTGF